MQSRLDHVSRRSDHMWTTSGAGFRNLRLCDINGTILVGFSEVMFLKPRE